MATKGDCNDIYDSIIHVYLVCMLVYVTEELYKKYADISLTSHNVAAIIGNCKALQQQMQSETI